MPYGAGLEENINSKAKQNEDMPNNKNKNKNKETIIAGQMDECKFKKHQTKMILQFSCFPNTLQIHDANKAFPGRLQQYHLIVKYHMIALSDK